MPFKVPKGNIAFHKKRYFLKHISCNRILLNTKGYCLFQDRNTYRGLNSLLEPKLILSRLNQFRFAVRLKTRLKSKLQLIWEKGKKQIEPRVPGSSTSIKIEGGYRRIGDRPLNHPPSFAFEAEHVKKISRESRGAGRLIDRS